MTPHERALELVDLAKSDEHAAHVLQADSGTTDAVIGFHYQQAAEKLLKSLLAERDVDYPKTHDLIRLLRLCQQESCQPPVTESQLKTLSPFAVTLRYESDEQLSALDCPAAEALLETLREWVEGQLSI